MLHWLIVCKRPNTNEHWTVAQTLWNQYMFIKDGRHVQFKNGVREKKNILCKSCFGTLYIYEISVSILYGIVRISWPILPAGPQFISVCMFFFFFWLFVMVMHPLNKIYANIFTHFCSCSRAHSHKENIQRIYFVTPKNVHWFETTKLHYMLWIPLATLPWTWLWNVEYIKYINVY